MKPKRQGARFICKFRRLSRYDSERAVTACAAIVPSWRTSYDPNDITCEHCRKLIAPVTRENSDD